MSKRPDGSAVLLLGTVLAAAAFVFVSCAGTQPMPVSSTHPAVEKNPACGQCHEGKEALDHNSEWPSRHEFTRGPQKADCVFCHGDIAACGGVCHPG